MYVNEYSVCVCVACFFSLPFSYICIFAPLFLLLFRSHHHTPHPPFCTCSSLSLYNMLSAALSASTPPSNDTRRPPSVNNSDDSGEQQQQPRTAHIRIVPHLDSSRSLVFSIIERDLTEDTVLKIGRFTDRFLTSNRITFRSKVVSRGHAEIWSSGGKVCVYPLLQQQLLLLLLLLAWHSRLTTH